MSWYVQLLLLFVTYLIKSQTMFDLYVVCTTNNYLNNVIVFDYFVGLKCICTSLQQYKLLQQKGRFFKF